EGVEVLGVVGGELPLDDVGGLRGVGVGDGREDEEQGDGAHAPGYYRGSSTPKASRPKPFDVRPSQSFVPPPTETSDAAGGPASQRAGRSTSRRPRPQLPP